MGRLLAVLGGVGLGAALMYLFDPNGGGRRRALIRDKAVGLSHDISDAVEGKARDLRNRAKGLAHEAGSLVSGSGSSSSPAQMSVQANQAN